MRPPTKSATTPRTAWMKLRTTSTPTLTTRTSPVLHFHGPSLARAVFFGRARAAPRSRRTQRWAGGDLAEAGLGAVFAADGGRAHLRDARRSFGTRIDDTQARQPAPQPAREPGNVALQIAHHADNRREALRPIPALERAAQTCADHRPQTRWIEPAVTIARGQECLHAYTPRRMRNNNAAEAAGDAIKIAPMHAAAVRRPRRAHANDPDKPKPRPG